MDAPPIPGAGADLHAEWRSVLRVLAGLLGVAASVFGLLVLRHQLVAGPNLLGVILGSGAVVIAWLA